MPTSTESLLANLRAEVRAEVLAEIQTLTFAQIVALLHGSGANSHAAFPVKRGPGRPRKAVYEQAPAPRHPSTSGRARRSAEDLKRVVMKVAALLNDNPDGLSSEEIQKSLGIQKAQLTGPIALGLSDGTFSKKGERRGTKYFARPAKPAGGGDGTGIKKPKK